MTLVATTLAGALLAVALPAGPAAAATAPPRAMYVWQWQDPQAVVSVATQRGVGTLFVAVPADLATSSQLPAVRALVAAATASGLRVDALGGDPGWVDQPTWALDHWLRPTLATGLFSGVHVDVEPWTTSAWTKKQGTTVSRYLTLLDTLVAAASPRPVEADIPFWFDGVTAGKRSTLDREVMRRVAGVTVMAYRNTATGTDGTIALAATELAVGASLGTPVRVGQETMFLGTDPVSVKQTFYGQTLTRMESQLALVDAGAGAYAAYAGIAVHDYTAWSAMAP
ncbi:hypothetical protein [Intrasporangium sp. YIM S08009]|uniref:hypothetical protein n=1 Tax=Intrasporangium zincisolvens TaxID=3080018 RepID=UPI002B05C487|nr:hypothetical protein [Intrasporangium sp. YIM S08009]